MRTLTVLVAVLALALCGCGSPEAQLDRSEPWDLVWFSDSLGWGVAQAWADRIEETEGVEVRVHDHAIGLLSAVSVQEWLSGDPEIRAEVAEAEIIVVNGNPNDSGATVDMETCLSTSTLDRDPPGRYSPADFAPYAEVLREIYGAVFELRSGQPTVVRAFDPYSGVIADWREAGIDVECTAAWSMWVETIREVADEFGVVTVSMYDAFNGADHREDPREKDYIGGDGIHASADGLAFQVEVIHALGYDPIVP